MLSIKELRENKRTTTRYQILVAGLLWTRLEVTKLMNFTNLTKSRTNSYCMCLGKFPNMQVQRALKPTFKL